MCQPVSCQSRFSLIFFVQQEPEPEPRARIRFRFRIFLGQNDTVPAVPVPAPVPVPQHWLHVQMSQAEAVLWIRIRPDVKLFAC